MSHMFFSDCGHKEDKWHKHEGGPMFLGVIADDFTGATDIAGFLVSNGLSTVQLNGVSDIAVPSDIEAVVISLKSRSCPPEEATELSRSALRYLKANGCVQFFFKYCSTFDSTAKGNIGPVTDTLLRELGETFTVICPALPVNGRTVCHGHLFVNGILLNESGMRNHPLNPMLDSNLMRIMDAQSSGKTGNVPLSVISNGPQAVRDCFARLKENGYSYAVLDTVDDKDLDILAKAVGNMKLVTGGSGLGGALARLHAVNSKHKAGCSTELGRPRGGKTVILSGSCSEMTNKQVDFYRNKAPFHQVSVERCIENATQYAKETMESLVRAPQSTLPPLVSATVPPFELEEIQNRCGVWNSHKQVENFFATLAVLLRDAGYTHFIIAGGETSSAVSQALGVKGFHIGPQIAPGVPWVRAIDADLSLVLKSGNFGGPEFFLNALQVIKETLPLQ